jgi:hypothetical protein
MQWGGSELGEEAGPPRRLAMATALSSVCRSLEVEIVRDWHIGLSEYWGKVGHYKLGALACELVHDAALKRLMMANQLRIGCSDDALEVGDVPRANQQEFVALADVPDLVFRATRKMDEANHFADMDQPGKGEFAGKTLLVLWKEGRRDPADWTAFYDVMDVKLDKRRGALPFRIWQIYQELVGYAAGGELAEFVCAAGILAHYVGDASQPLHVSHLHHGSDPSESGVHSLYETAMMDRNAAELMVEVGKARRRVPRQAPFEGGARAADAAVSLMERALALLPPTTVIEVFDQVRGRGQVANMWAKLKEPTATLLVDGATTLAAIWESAWSEGQGALARTARLEIEKRRLVDLYRDHTFIEAAWLKNLLLVDGRLQIRGSAEREARGDGHAAPARPARPTGTAKNGHRVRRPTRHPRTRRDERPRPPP